jgi:hypothetical protein
VKENLWNRKWRSIQVEVVAFVVDDDGGDDDDCMTGRV